jgi:4-amino-4-deoxy-L-arabinose transferase-like glycosyltransferase
VSSVSKTIPHLPVGSTQNARRLLVIGIVVGIVAAYFATRLSFIARFPYFVDEGTYAQFIYQGAHPPYDLFMSMTIGKEPMQAWLGILLVELGFNSLTAVRLVSVFSGLATVGVVGLLGRRMGGVAVGLAAAALSVVFPFFFVHDGIGIEEPLVTLIMASALYVQIQLARRPDLRRALLLGLILACGYLTKQSTLPALALIPVSLVCFDWSPDGRRQRVVLWLLGIVLVLVMVAGADLLLRASSHYKEFVAVRKSGAGNYPVRSLSAVLANPFAGWSQSWSIYRPALESYVTFPLIAAAVVGAMVGLKRRPQLTAVLLTWLVVPFLVALLFTESPFPRNVMYVMPPAIVLMAYAFAEGGRWALRMLPHNSAAVAVAATAIALLLPALRFDARVLAHPATTRYPSLDDWQYVTGVPAGSPWPSLADAIHRFAAGQRVVVATPVSVSYENRFDPAITELLLDNNPRYVFVESSSPLAREAKLAVTDSARPLGEDIQSLRVISQQSPVLIAQFARPRSPDAGATTTSPRKAQTVRLYELGRQPSPHIKAAAPIAALDSEDFGRFACLRGCLPAPVA